MKQTDSIDWKSLGFHYTETDYIVRCTYRNGQWSALRATRSKHIQLHVAATCLQYGQQSFEGLKAFRGIDGRIRIFRMEDNASRMQASAEGLCMQSLPVHLFCEAILLALKKNIRYLPPYHTGATLYFRPLLLSTTPRIAVGPGHEFEFIVVATPIGPYFPVGFHGTPFIINRNVDRAAPLGTGTFKVGGNYAASFRATEAAHAMGMSCIFLDARKKKYIDECGAANFFGIKPLPQAEGEEPRFLYVTPKSTSILPSITNDSLMTLAKQQGLSVQRRHIPVEELSEFTECGACGTAAVISPISRIIDPDKAAVYEYGTAPGPVSCRLYQSLQDIQYGRTPDSHHWCTIL